MIRPIIPADAAAAAGIYNYYIENTAVTFEETPLSVPDMERRIGNITAAWPWLVREESGGVMGYAYANLFRDRPSYRHTVEISVYVRHGGEGRGAGKELLAALLARLRAMPVHAVLSCITLPNDRSAALHEKAGFRKAGHFEEAGRKFGRWHTVGYWELLLPLSPAEPA